MQDGLPKVTGGTRKEAPRRICTDIRKEGVRRARHHACCGRSTEPLSRGTHIRSITFGRHRIRPLEPLALDESVELLILQFVDEHALDLRAVVV